MSGRSMDGLINIDLRKANNTTHLLELLKQMDETNWLSSKGTLKKQYGGNHSGGRNRKNRINVPSVDSFTKKKCRVKGSDNSRSNSLSKHIWIDSLGGSTDSFKMQTHKRRNNAIGMINKFPTTTHS
jgi:hypothetical protein